MSPSIPSHFTFNRYSPNNVCLKTKREKTSAWLVWAETGSGLNWRHSGSDSHDSLWERWQFHKRVRNRTHSIFILRFVVKRLHCMLCGVCRVSTVFLIACQLLNGAFSQIHFLPQFILKHFLYFQDEFLTGFNTVFYRLNSTNLCEYGLEMDVLKRIRQCCLSNFRDGVKMDCGLFNGKKTAGFICWSAK